MMSSLVDSASLGGGGGPQGLPGSAGASMGQRDELKTQFMTREGLYKLMTLSEYSRPNRVGYANTAANPGAPVRVSFALPTLPLQQQQQSKSAKASASAIPNGSLGSTSTASSSTGSDDQTHKNGSEVWSGEKIAFNYGREIFVYPYKGVKKAADLTKPIDKRIYKGTSPTCHDFGAVVSGAADASSGGEGVIPMLVGFTGGQIQLVDPVRKELSKLYNEERLVEQSRGTCIKWIPGTPNLFLVSYSSGFMYVYNHELVCPPTAPVYQTFMQGEGYSVHTCKTKTTRNPLYRWTIGTPPSGSSSSSSSSSNQSSPSAVNEFSFSPCGKYLAVASQDGYLRVFYYNTMKLTGQARSYFGGLLCVAWSPDGKYIVTGGEDDLVNVYSVAERRIVVRGQGHKSWVSVVAFDSYNMSYGAVPDGLDFSGSDEEGSSMNNGCSRGAVDSMQPPTRSSMPFLPGGGSDGVSSSSSQQQHVTCYRFGSVGEDTHICLWDMTEDTLKKASSALSASAGAAGAASGADLNTSQSGRGDDCHDGGAGQGNPNAPGSVSGASAATSSSLNTTKSSNSSSSSGGNSLTSRLAALSFGGGDKKEHKRNFSLPSRSSGDKASSSAKGSASSQASQAAACNGSSSSSSLAAGAGGNAGGRREHVRLGSPQCPRLNEVPLIEPLVMKKIAHERLTELIFREECLVTACQDGYVCTWARPTTGKRQQQQQHANHQSLGTGGYPMTCPGSPPATGGGGTIV